MTHEERADLILIGLGGQHLRDFLPDGNHKAAIAHAVSGAHGWSWKGTWGRVHKGGISRYRSLQDLNAGQPEITIAWREVLDVVARGLGDGRREAYEEAYQLWNAWCHSHGYGMYVAKDDPARQPKLAKSAELYSLAVDGIRSTTEAIVRAGCQPRLEQGLLW